VTGPAAADEAYMSQALSLAERGRGTSHPNPVVGAVIVRKGDVLARGFHRRAGLPHAEIVALTRLGMRAPGATLYVTLEPCCHSGRTGPCTDAILAAGITRVVIGCRDENPLVSGRGIRILRRAGLEVVTGCLQDECHRQNRAFFTWIRRQRPWIVLKAAATLDGFIGDRREGQRSGPTRWITGVEARAWAHRMRAEHDAVLVGIGTILADDPLLTVRLAGSSRHRRLPLRVVLDSRLRTPTTAALLRPAGGHPPPLLVARAPSRADPGLAARAKRLTATGAEVVLLAPDSGRDPDNDDGHVALPPLLRELAGRQVQSLLVEGGSRIHGAFLRQHLLDAIALFLAPRLVGRGVPVVEGGGLDFKRPAKLGPMHIRRLGSDVLITADVIDPGQVLRST